MGINCFIALEVGTPSDITHLTLFGLGVPYDSGVAFVGGFVGFQR